jgi:hypothetical protein
MLFTFGFVFFFVSFTKNVVIKKAGDLWPPALGEEKLKEELYGGC